MAMPIRLLTLDDLDPYIEHMRVHAAESGRDGDVVFMPYGEDTPFDPEPSREIRQKSWAVAVGEIDWSRCWAVLDGDRIAGHAELYGARVEAALHRARLGMGLLRPYRGQGHGRRLLDTVVDWARAQRFIHWIDLGVFGANATARSLYASAGFQEIGVVEDNFRVDGASIDDIQMALRLADRDA